jgi:hypothetical protein
LRDWCWRSLEYGRERNQFQRTISSQRGICEEQIRMRDLKVVFLQKSEQGGPVGVTFDVTNRTGIDEEIPNGFFNP